MHAVAPITFALVSANLVNAVANWTLIYGHFGFRAMGVPGAAWATVLSRVYMVVVLAIAVVLYDRRGPAACGRRRGASRSTACGGWCSSGCPPPRRSRSRSACSPWPRRWPGGSTRCRAPRTRSPSTSPASRSWCRSASPRRARCASATGSGARIRTRAALAGWTAILLGAGSMAATAALFLLAPQALVGLFTQDAAVLALGGSLLFIAAVFQLFDGLQGSPPARCAASARRACRWSSTWSATGCSGCR